MFSKSPLKSADDDRLWVANPKKSDGGYFKRMSKTNRSRSEQSLLLLSDGAKKIEEAFAQANPTIEIGNETMNAVFRHGVNRITENEQFIMLSKTPIKDGSRVLAEGVHVMHSSEAYYAFFQHSTCYDLMPYNSKLVVLDSTLQVGKAFRALVLNGVRAALIWQAVEQRFVGILTITDFIKILNICIDKTDFDVENQTVDKWREFTNPTERHLLYVTPESSMFMALKELKHHRVHRLPVIDERTGNVLHIITHKRLLKYLFIKKSSIPPPDFLKCTVESENVGTFDEVYTVNMCTSIKEVLSLFERKCISAVPVVDKSSGRLVDIYAKFDCIHLASTGNYKDLNLTIQQALKFRVLTFQVQTCLKTDSLEFVMEKIVRKEVHRLVIINNEQDRQVEGILSLADLLHYFVLRHAGRHSLGDTGCCSSASLFPGQLTAAAAVGGSQDRRRISSPDALSVALASSPDSQSLKRAPSSVSGTSSVG